MHDVSDTQLGRIIVTGAIRGTIGLFVVCMAIGLLAGASLVDAAGIAAVPAFFGGWFYGGTVSMLRAAYGPSQAERPPDTKSANEDAAEERIRQAA